MGKKYLIDTNVIIDLSVGKLPADALKLLANIIDATPQISIVNKIELLSLKNVSPQIESFVDNAFVFPLDNDVADKTIELRKNHKIKLPDAVIAATALIQNLILITHNISDFQNIRGLKVIDSHLLK
ncbi:MAG TPA: type II toxin-antitoxin system VapC family toxin [Mucilaginibacter sp.]